jgi:hypothetical protein
MMGRQHGILQPLGHLGGFGIEHHVLPMKSEYYREEGEFPGPQEIFPSQVLVRSVTEERPRTEPKV